MKKLFLILILVIGVNCVKAQNAMWVYNSDGTVSTYKISEIDSLNFSSNMIQMLLQEIKLKEFIINQVHLLLHRFSNF